ncbi:hypothetical protein IWX48DRAFT_629670 [Phyllosticta citricarpa]
MRLSLVSTALFGSTLVFAGGPGWGGWDGHTPGKSWPLPTKSDSEPPWVTFVTTTICPITSWKGSTTWTSLTTSTITVTSCKGGCSKTPTYVPPPTTTPTKPTYVPPPTTSPSQNTTYVPPPKSHTSPSKSYSPPPKSHTPPPKSHTPPPESSSPPPKSHTVPPYPSNKTSTYTELTTTYTTM